MRRLLEWGRLIDLSTELSMRPELAHCHLGLGKLYRRTGDRAKACEHLTTATTMYREMDMALLAGAGGGGTERRRPMTRVGFDLPRTRKQPRLDSVRLILVVAADL